MHSSFVLAALACFSENPIGSEHIVMNHYYARHTVCLYLLSSFFVDRYTFISQAVRQTFPI